MRTLIVTLSLASVVAVLAFPFSWDPQVVDIDVIGCAATADGSRCELKYFMKNGSEYSDTVCVRARDWQIHICAS